jgi:DNA invertase Pin-like site-specific DNA recombinase
MVSVAELEAGMIGTRTRAALAAAKARGKALGGTRTRKSDGQRVVISRTAQKTGAAANRRRATDRAADLAPSERFDGFNHFCRHAIDRMHPAIFG